MSYVRLIYVLCLRGYAVLIIRIVTTLRATFLRLSVSIDIHSSQYEHFTDMADLNVEVEIGTWENSWKNYNLKRLIRVPQCYQNPNNPSTIDLIKSNCQRSFQTSCAIETGFSNFHRTTVNSCEGFLPKTKAKSYTL